MDRKSETEVMWKYVHELRTKATILFIQINNSALKKTFVHAVSLIMMGSSITGLCVIPFRDACLNFSKLQCNTFIKRIILTDGKYDENPYVIYSESTMGFRISKFTTEKHH